jgi:hypothetical protein
MTYKQKGFAVLEAFLILVIVGIISFVGWYIWHAKQNTDMSYNAALKSGSSLANKSSAQGSHAKVTDTSQGSSTQSHSNSFVLPADWSWYTNAELGIKLAYPNAWRAPRPIDKTANIKGNSYNVSWFSSGKYLINLYMDSEDSQLQGCKDSSPCTTYPTGNTKSAYTTAINRISKNDFDSSYFQLVYHDSSSYATLLTNAGEGATDVIDEYQIADLNKINVSAVHGEYQLFNASAACPQKQVSPVNGSRCVTQSLVDDFTKLMKSIQSI